MPEPARMQHLLRELLFVAISAERRNNPWVASRLTRSLGAKRVAAGETLFTAGELPDLVYFMTDGKIRFSRPGSPDIERHGRWGLGVQDAITMTPRRRTAVALTDLQLLTVPAAAWLEVLDDRTDLAREMAMNMARQVLGMQVKLAPDGGFAAPGSDFSVPMDAMNVVERLLFLRAVPYFASSGVQALADLARGAEEVTFAPGEAVFARGAPRDRLHVVISGLVEAVHLEPRVSARFAAGDLVGGAAALGDVALAWEARALQTTRALAVPVEIFVDELEDHFDLFRSAVGALIDQREDLLDLMVQRTGENVFR